MQLQSKEHRGWPGATRSWERGLEHILPQSLQKELTLPTSWPPTPRQTTFLHLKPPSLWYLLQPPWKTIHLPLQRAASLVTPTQPPHTATFSCVPCTAGQASPPWPFYAGTSSLYNEAPEVQGVTDLPETPQLGNRARIWEQTVRVQFLHLLQSPLSTGALPPPLARGLLPRNVQEAPPA